MDTPSCSQPGTPPAPHLAGLDIARGIAILLVLVFHTMDAALGVNRLSWAGWWPDFAHTPKTLLAVLPVAFGWSGVAVFFAVSGFCIHLSAERSTGAKWESFFIRRFFRIYPPYLLAVCFFAFVFPSTRYGEATLGHAAQVGSHLLLAHNFHTRLVCGINPSFWSIAVEVQLYLLYPLLLLGVKRWGWARTLLAAGAIEGTLRLCDYLWTFPCYVNTSPFYYWLSWAAGAKLADDHVHGQPLFLSRLPWQPFAALTAFAFFCRPLEAFSFLLVALTTVRLLGASLAAPAGSAPPSLSARALSGLGAISYSLYLLHQPLLSSAAQAVKGAFPPGAVHPLLLFAGGLLLCVPITALAWLFYRAVEQPSIAWGKRVLQRRRSRASNAVPAAYAK